MRRQKHVVDKQRSNQAIEQERKTLELDPSFTSAHTVLGLAYVQKSMFKKALVEFERALVISPGEPMALSGLGYAYAISEKRTEAQKVLDQRALEAKVCSSLV